MSKYYSRRVTVDGIKFQSQREARRYQELKLLEKGGYISDLRLQVPFLLIPAQKQDGKVIEHKVSYYADFVYMKDGKQIVEDAKGVRTDVYKLKRKLMRYVHGIEIREV